MEQQGCTAENWSNIDVSEDGFRVEMIKNVSFMGDVEIGNMLTSGISIITILATE